MNSSDNPEAARSIIDSSSDDSSDDDRNNAPSLPVSTSDVRKSLPPLLGDSVKNRTLQNRPKPEFTTYSSGDESDGHDWNPYLELSCSWFYWNPSQEEEDTGKKRRPRKFHNPDILRSPKKD